MKHKIMARADIIGSQKYGDINGKVLFYETENGVIVSIEIKGLPRGEACEQPIYAIHIHEGSRCSGDNTDEFADVRAHFNPDNCKHPYHAGDMPALFSDNGYALLIFITNRFAVRDIIGRTVIVHSQPDDYMTQPSGNAGEKIACGVIKKV